MKMRDHIPDLMRTLLVGAQLLSLVALALGLQFVVNTTGGTLFLFSALAPLLVFVSILILSGVALHRFRKRHSLFVFKTFAPGETIVREGEHGDCAYFIQSGEVQVVRRIDGAERPVGNLGAGQYFGEMALLSNSPRNATVHALTATKVALLGKSNFLTMLSVMPTAQEDILKTVQRRASEQASG